MKLACSNLAWAPENTDWALGKLIENGFEGVEIAPVHQWGAWDLATPEAAGKLLREVRARDLSVAALQGILFGRADLQLFDRSCWPELILHVGSVARLAEAMQARVLVLGAPGQRDVRRAPQEGAHALAVDILSLLAGVCHDHGVTLCIEPNARINGCNFVYSSTQGRAIVQEVAHPGLGLHLDAAAMFLENENLTEVIAGLEAEELGHFHISEPGLAGLSEPQVPHREALQALSRSGYRQWVSIETIRQAEFGISLKRVAAWTHGRTHAAFQGV